MLGNIKLTVTLHQSLQYSLTVGKRQCSLDLNVEEDRAQLHRLLEEADVVVQGYRQGALERKGFGLHDVLHMASRRGKGMVYIDEVNILPL